MPCLAKDEHCCWLNGVQCKYLEENTVPGRRWACGLKRRYNTWDAAINSEEYKQDIEPHFGPKGINCKDWPDIPHTKCFACGFGVQRIDHGWRKEWQ